MKKVKRRTRKKPTGVTGLLSIPADPGVGAFSKVQFPAQKDEIERYILAGALQGGSPRLSERYGLTSVPVQNAESDFDFTLPTASGNQYLDLVEFAPTGGRNSPYRDAPLSYVVRERGDEVIAVIRKKAAHYGQTGTPVHLLVYSTEHRYRLCDDVINWVSLWSARSQHPFTTIHYYFPEEGESGELLAIYPRPSADLEELRPDEFGGRQIALADFTNAEIGAGGQLTVKLGSVAPPGPGPIRIRIRARIAPENDPS